jgi:hypothetical protein
MLITNHKPYKMKALLLVCLCFLSFNFLNAQERFLKIYNSDTGKEFRLNENKRVRVLTKYGSKISGKFYINDQESVIVRGTKVDLEDIIMIKQHPLAVTFITNTFTFGAGLFLTAYGLFGAALVDTAYLLFLIPAAGSIYGGLQAPNISKAYKTAENWKYEVVLPEKTAKIKEDLAL